MELKDLLTYTTPEDNEEKEMDRIKHELKAQYDNLDEDSKLEVQEGMFMDFLSEIENKVNSMLETYFVTGMEINEDTFKQIANRCFSKIIESKERQNTQPGEKEFMIMFVKAIGDILNQTYNIKKIYLDK